MTRCDGDDLNYCMRQATVKCAGCGWELCKQHAVHHICMNNLHQRKEEIMTLLSGVQPPNLGVLSRQEMLERADSLIGGDLTVENPSPVGSAGDIKRFYLGTKVKYTCPSCGENEEHDLDTCPLTYPEFNTPFTFACYCDKCGNEWEAKSKLMLRVELAVVK